MGEKKITNAIKSLLFALIVLYGLSKFITPVYATGSDTTTDETTITNIGEQQSTENIVEQNADDTIKEEVSNNDSTSNEKAEDDSIDEDDDSSDLIKQEEKEKEESSVLSSSNGEDGNNSAGEDETINECIDILSSFSEFELEKIKRSEEDFIDFLLSKYEEGAINDL